MCSQKVPNILASERVPVRARSAGPWQRELQQAIRNPAELCGRLGLSACQIEAARAGDREFGVFVPEPYLRRITPGDPNDPLLLQVLPTAAEAETAAGYSTDPVGDLAAQQAPGVIHKYAGRALLVTTGVCPVHCRYCFRRHFPYDQLPRGVDAWDRALDSIAADRTIREVILSGGDPLMLVDATLERLAIRLRAIQHVERLRIHTRMPIMIPSRVCDALLRWLAAWPTPPVMVVHVNHPREIDAEVADACARLRQGGVLLLNQAVLLRDVNDDVDTQCALSRRLLDVGVAPYYLHQLDQVAGAAHYEVPIAQGRRILETMRERLPGYAVPRYVQEIAGERSKTPL